MTHSINCIIIEDEKPAADLLATYISRVELLHLAGTFTSGTQAMRCLTTQKIDLIFTDINLPGISGVDFIRSLTPAPNVIFTTAHAQYAVDGFDLDAVDFLLKPIPFERFLKAIHRFIKLDKQLMEAAPRQEQPEKEPPFIFIKCDKKMVKIFLDDILFFESQKNYLLINTSKEVYKTYHSISEMEEKLPESTFVRIHRSFIVSIPKIEKFNSNAIEINSISIPIGRHYGSTTTQALKSYQQSHPSFQI
ncbi:MAG: response regulator transcription factor [Chitinophaga sp.]|uniref:LytR/AlgR family response regulator transcription factor n=1 Tax=Chitinophaga sp. TaxID=1869181 RepID=UPI0025BB9E3A|nr:LytTR family DNA-binding domain-containing protein [Chitinophaga sp.]MBV8253067.1 response regulator transcription factor [Chitinophaga sp.]